MRTDTMGLNVDRWTVLKVAELVAVIGCLAFKRVTDDEAQRLFLYLQKLSQEWSLLNNITWDRLGSAVADATYGGYVIITAALLIGRLTGELPTFSRISEYILLGVGALLFIILGSLEFAALDSVPHNLVDNAAILGTLSLIVAGLFLVDMGGPKARKQLASTHSQTSPRSVNSKAMETRSIKDQVYDIEKEIAKNEKHLDTIDHINNNNSNNHSHNKNDKNSRTNGYVGGLKVDPDDRYSDNSVYRRIRDEKSIKTFDIYGKDALQDDDETDDDDDEAELPPKLEEHSPVWSKLRKGPYDKFSIITPYQYSTKQLKIEQERPPSGPGDPGYVQYTAQHWGETAQKTPRHSPTEV